MGGVDREVSKISVSERLVMNIPGSRLKRTRPSQVASSVKHMSRLHMFKKHDEAFDTERPYGILINR